MASTSIEDIKLNNLHIQGIHIKQYQLARLFEFGHGDQAYSLARRTANDCGLESWLVAYEVDVWTFLKDKLVFFLKRITPCANPSVSASWT